MVRQPTTLVSLTVLLLLLVPPRSQAGELLSIPDRLVVLTFDDGNRSDITFTAGVLERCGFGATFFITSGLVGQKASLKWSEVRQLREQGFEIANHSVNHPNMVEFSKEQSRVEIVGFDEACRQHDLPRATTFAYPGGHNTRLVVEVLTEERYRFARRCGDPELPVGNGGRGVAYDPKIDHPLLIPTTLFSEPDSTLDDLAWAVDQATGGRIAVLTFHGVPDVHPHCSTDPAAFERYMKYLQARQCTVIAMRDLARYVEPSQFTQDPYSGIRRRIGVDATELRCEYATDPLGIDTRQPRFSWTVTAFRRDQRQSAYRILVSSSKEQLTADVGDQWDSGKVATQQSVNVPYQGLASRSGEQCWWKVQCFNKPGNDGQNAVRRFLSAEVLEMMRSELPGAFSEPATFTMGLLEPADWQGVWIAADADISGFCWQEVDSGQTDQAGNCPHLRTRLLRTSSARPQNRRSRAGPGFDVL